MASMVSSGARFRTPRIDLQATDKDCDAIRTVPELIDFNAKHNPDQLFCLQATKAGQDVIHATTIAITHLQLWHAISRCSTRLIAEIAELKLPFENSDGGFTKSQPVALYLESDVGLLIHLFSLMSLGVPVVLLSARLSPTAVYHLLAETRATTIITTPRLANTIKTVPLPVTSSHSSEVSPVTPMVHIQRPYEHDLRIDPTREFSEGSICAPNYFMSETDRNVLVLHSSGTTRLPKPIYQPHRYLLGFSVCHQRSDHEDIAGLNLSTLPLYHGFGLLAAALSLGVGKPFWLASAHVVPTGPSTVDALRSSGARSLMTVPLILEEISLLPEDQGVQALVRLQFVACGGGPLKPSVGNVLAAAGVKLLSHFGATEVGPMTPIFAPTLGYDWHYFRLRQDIHLELQPIDSEEEEAAKYYKLTAYPFGWDTAFELQDRLLSSPENPKTDFKAVGRNDDLIVLITGEKVLPRILESMLSESELVKAAVAFGDGQFELGVIVEPAEPFRDSEQFKSSIWPIILRAGDQMDDHARISSTASIIVVPPGRSIPRSDKGSVLRKEAYRVFEAEISKMYQDLNESTTGASDYPLDTQNLEEGLKKLIQFGLNWRAFTTECNYHDDLFELGMNSLQALRLRRLLLSSISDNALLSPAAECISIDFVYQNPSIAKIAEALRSNDNLNATQIDHGRTIEDFIELYSLEQPSAQDAQLSAPEVGSVVLLTGGSGSLGSHILAQLASLPSIARIVCLNRLPTDVGHGKDLREQQFKTAERKGVTISVQDKLKIEVVQIEPGAIRLGLDDSGYARLRNTVTHILHCAWPMDFKRTLPSFQTQFRFLQSLLNLAKDAHESRPLIRPRLLFVSSIAVVGQYARGQDSRMVPEIPMQDSHSTNHFGYGKAKLVCERMVENAARSHGNQMELLCVRVGQVSGSRRSGFWNPNEHFPALIQLSQAVSRLPKIDGTLSWLPVDSAAEILTELLLVPHQVNLIYHLENPVRQSWHDILTTLASKLDISDAGLIPFDEWMNRVATSATGKGTKDDTSTAPMLADFFQQDFQHMSGGNVILDTARARAISPTLRGMKAVDGELVARYVDNWRRMGFLA
ncbi:hypothetical protein GJ744_010020 [Endocarpon pusillum]|uniref:Carrier domain-containing protein n=1 Tax=Endocarpon pusillum TaxID=364733 RepID=A0A8H7AIR3_9EURO|nr:hypothetical protein GJ744_010020 [Endocarpon pusillum]